MSTIKPLVVGVGEEKDGVGAIGSRTTWELALIKPERAVERVSVTGILGESPEIEIGSVDPVAVPSITVPSEIAGVNVKFGS